MSTCRISTLPAELQQAFRDCLASVEAGFVGAPLLELVGTLRKYVDHQLDSKDLLLQFTAFLLFLKNGLPNHTPDWAAKVMQASNLPADLKCTFCGKLEREVSKLVSGPAVLICNGCIELCSDIVRPEVVK